MCDEGRANIRSFFFIYRIGHVSNPRGINQNRERKELYEQKRIKIKAIARSR